MQLDMHFYGVYALARAAGIKDTSARIIAYASQFVDDSIDDDHVILTDERAIVPTMTSHKPIDYQNALPGDQWKVWIPFHFLPGNKGENFIERMVCQKDSEPAQKMLDFALDPKNSKYWPHLIGIVTHVYADTFAHYGFIGFSHDWNKVNENTIDISNKHSKGILQYIKCKFEEFKTRFTSNFAELIPVGHGAVATYPDRPYLSWSYKYETHSKNKVIKRNNFQSFKEGCQCIHSFFSEYSKISQKDSDPASKKDWEDIFEVVKDILMTEGPKYKRIKLWKEHINNSVFSKVTAVDREIQYDEGLWRPRRAEFELKKDSHIEDTNACKFIRAAWKHRYYVLHELLPSVGLIIY